MNEVKEMNEFKEMPPWMVDNGRLVDGWSYCQDTGLIYAWWWDGDLERRWYPNVP